MSKDTTRVSAVKCSHSPVHCIRERLMESSDSVGSPVGDQNRLCYHSGCSSVKAEVRGQARCRAAAHHRILPPASRCLGAFPAPCCERKPDLLSYRMGGVGGAGGWWHRGSGHRTTASVSYPLLAAPELPAEPSLLCVTGFRPSSSCSGREL